ncbi:MAG: hypothetical protein Q8928_10995 [Bacteroidota bacterium]|nr:hypothetical protein [Bacteroidota bacterium]
MRITTVALGVFICLAFVNKSLGQSRGDVRIMFYNTENLFDAEDDPQTQDDDFTPNGKQHWTKDKYNHKLFNIFKTIVGVGEWTPPEIIGLCEVENRRVLIDLLHRTPLDKYQYGIAHFESPDPRGIDVALLYRTDKFKLLSQQPLHISFKNSPNRKTRDILMVKLKFPGECGDTLFLFVNHWPSRRGGEIESEDSRVEVAQLLKHKTDSLLRKKASAKIIIMGDFNDEPDNSSLTQYLQAQTSFSRIVVSELYNLTAGSVSSQTPGTHKFSGQWSTFDQLIVSGGLLLSSGCLSAKASGAHIYNGDFLFQPDARNLGKKLFPTFSGPQYLGGFSDHLPVYLDVLLQN